MLLMGFASLLMSGGSSGYEDAGLHEVRIEGSGPDKIALIEVHGVILDIPQGGLFGGGPSLVRSVQRQLRQAAADPAVRAVLLSVDSPGGGVTDSDLLYNEVKKVRAAGKLVVVHAGDLCASGGYYLSAPADSIVAAPTCVTGSIGVIMNHLKLKGLYEKIGVEETPIKSGPHKDILSSARDMTPEEQAILQGVIDQMYDRFVTIVAEGRAGRGPLPAGPEVSKDAVKKLADGRIYTGEQAVANGLADKVGYLEDALAEAKRLAGLSEAKLICYRRPPSLMEALSGQARGGAGPAVNINQGVQIDAGALLQQYIPRFEYRWAP
ncbi:MAG: signal peptide peptidase SppA [Planctomycetota bacterium]|nr:signal peptide peptidase SppA [Planctomycetota bacterium]